MKIKLICGEKTAVLVNDFGNIGIDGELISQVGALNVIELPSGCICCSLRAGLIIEPTGIAIPSAILETLQGHEFSKFFEIEAVIGNGLKRERMERDLRGALAEQEKI